VVDDRLIVSPNGGRRRQRRPFFLLAGLLVVLCFGAACESTTAERQDVLARVNQSRATIGLPPLKRNLILDIKADKWARHLRDICDLEHSKLSDGAPNEWLKLGENVGYGGSIEQVHEAYMNSPGHKANILDPAFGSMGTAAVWGDCDGYRRVFTVHEFMKA